MWSLYMVPYTYTCVSVLAHKCPCLQNTATLVSVLSSGLLTCASPYPPILGRATFKAHGKSSLMLASQWIVEAVKSAPSNWVRRISATFGEIQNDVGGAVHALSSCIFTDATNCMQACAYRIPWG